VISPDLPSSELFEAAYDGLESTWVYSAGFAIGDPVLVCCYAINEICNGGFWQFYWNQGFDVEKFIVDLRAIGDVTLATIVEDSLALFENRSDARGGQERTQEIMEDKGLDQRAWDAIDRQFYQEMDQFYDHAGDYLRSHWDHYGPIVNASQSSG
jgi:hypothetical protein